MTLLEDLLDQTHAALLAGDLAALSGLDERLSAAAGALPPPSMATARRLQRKAEPECAAVAGSGARASRCARAHGRNRDRSGTCRL
jgi:hypothetical protein